MVDCAQMLIKRLLCACRSGAPVKRAEGFPARKANFAGDARNAADMLLVLNVHLVEDYVATLPKIHDPDVNVRHPWVGTAWKLCGTQNSTESGMGIMRVTASEHTGRPAVEVLLPVFILVREVRGRFSLRGDESQSPLRRRYHR